MSVQISLPIRLRDWAGLDNFYLPPESANKPLLLLLADENWQVMYLQGGPGTGKTHLLQASCRYWQEQHNKQVFYLPLQDFSEGSPSLLEGLDTYDLIALDDLDRIAGKSNWEEGIFHLFNALQLHSGRLLIAGQSAPKQLPLELPDLKSRMLSGSSWRLDELDELNLRKALAKRAERLGLGLPVTVVDYLFTRYSRDSKTLFDLLERLDSYAFNRQRQITLPLIRSYLQQQDENYERH